MGRHNRKNRFSCNDKNNLSELRKVNKTRLRMEMALLEVLTYDHDNNLHIRKESKA